MSAPIENVIRKAKLQIFADEATVSQKLCNFVTEKANEAISERGTFTVGVSGGSLAKFLCSGLPKANTDWSKWQIFFCDERHVAFDDKECTYTFYKDNLVDKIDKLTTQNIHPDNPNIPVEEAAEQYAAKLREVFQGNDIPRFDMLLLGMGPDGHTCSLFPGHALLQEKDKIIAAISDSPKPPPERITMTLPVVNNTKCAVFTSCGAGKADMVQRVVEGTEEPALPAARVQPHSGDLYWFLDEGAASKLKTK